MDTGNSKKQMSNKFQTASFFAILNLDIICFLGFVICSFLSNLDRVLKLRY